MVWEYVSGMGDKDQKKTIKRKKIKIFSEKKYENILF